MRNDTEVEAMTRAVIAWGHARWPGCRAIRELAMGDRRIDVVFVMPADLVGVEIKSSVDRLDRLDAQYREFCRYVPEVWIAVAPKWRGDVENEYRVSNKMVVADGVVELLGEFKVKLGDKGRRPHRDELSIMRMLEWLWQSEMVAIADRTEVVPGARHKQVLHSKVRPMLARLLTGNEILREVCRELRERPSVGRGSDRPIRTPTEPAVRPVAARVMVPGPAAPGAPRPAAGPGRA